MGYSNAHFASGEVWSLVARQHDVITHAQLLELGFTPKSIKHRLGTGRLFVAHRGVYAVGRPSLTQEGDWTAAILASADDAGLSHESAGVLFGAWAAESRGIEVSFARGRSARRPEVLAHRRVPEVLSRVTTYRGIRVTEPAQTIVDLASRSTDRQVERTINEFDRLDLIDPEDLRGAIDGFGPIPGLRRVRRVLDRHTFVLTHTELERLFLPIARRAGLPRPVGQHRRNGFRVDFYWPHLRLVVETDGLRHHRTPAHQARDTIRDHAHLAAGDYPLRFTHAQVKYDSGYVEKTLGRIARRLQERSIPAGARPGTP
ncbi:MAG: DUF559 domain-containing protein [Actinomycetota bacterium]|nr:DUF559 domain-containing protein [Actinomycetota bacterium]